MIPLERGFNIKEYSRIGKRNKFIQENCILPLLRRKQTFSQRKYGKMKPFLNKNMSGPLNIWCGIRFELNLHLIQFKSIKKDRI